MPTTRPRHMITETERISKALERAAELWPDSKTERTVLLRRILDAGIDAIEVEIEGQNVSRITLALEIAGSLTGVWPSNWREELRDEWPE